MRYFFQEINLNSKKDKIIEIYENIIKENKYKSKDILFLVPNSITRLSYKRKLNIPYTDKLQIVTYTSFVKSEIVKYWSIIQSDCNEINTSKISPSFISQSLSEYIIMDYLKKTREEENYFNDIVSTNKSICKSILDNFSKSCFNNLDINNIGEKIYNSKKNRDNLDRYSYTQMQEVIDFYVQSILSNGIVDDSMAVYLYNKYLLNNEIYRKRLIGDCKYIIVDSLENASASEVDLIEVLLKTTKDSYIFFDKTKDYSSFKNVDIDYTQERIIDKFFGNEEIATDKININSFTKLNININLNQGYNLYDEMIDGICEKVKILIENGKKLNDIAIISPINNSILDYKILSKLSKYNIEVKNTKIDSKIIDYPYANALVVALCIFYDLEFLIKDEEYVNFIEIIFELNKIQAIKLFNNRYEDNRYSDLINYIKDKQSQNLRTSEFLVQFYIEKMLNLKDGTKNVQYSKDIIRQADIFSEILQDLNIEQDKGKEIFIRCLKENINSYYVSYDIEQMKDEDSIILTTPYTYISANINRPIQLWLDIGSNAWCTKIEKDISNPLVLRKSFPEKEIYSDEIEDNKKVYYLYNLIYNLISQSEEVYAFKSEYSINGFVQESMLYGLLTRILGKGEMINE